MSETIPIRKSSFPQTAMPVFITSQSEAGYFLLKRGVDILLSSLLLIILSPLLLIVSLLVVLDSPGPPIYSQKRVGCKFRRNGRGFQKEVCTFTFYKFRSMYHGSSDVIHREFIAAYIHDDLALMKSLQQEKVEQGNQYKLNGDSRVTRMGRFLRKSSVDELPQLWNILKGEMSLVGPRPAIPYEVEFYEPWHMHRLAAMPGLTGLWQVTARNSASFDTMVRMDLEYIANQSFWLDMKILIKTPLAVIDRKCN